MYSRLKAVWDYVAQSRAKFESTPDKGLIGKSISRIFNVIWTYVFVGGVGAASILCVNPLICLSISTFSLLLCITMPLWYPLASVAMHLLFITFYDWEFAYCLHMNKAPLFFRLWRMFIGHLISGGIFQPILAAATSLIVCPTLSLLVGTRKFYICECFNNSLPSNN